MIVRNATQPHVFLNAIVAGISGKAPAQFNVETYRALRDEQRPVIYLAGGSWRAIPIWHKETGELIAVTLFNPGRTPDEVRAVEREIAVLAHLEYR